MDDEWTVVTEDGSLSAHYENTIVITDGKPGDSDADRRGSGCRDLGERVIPEESHDSQIRESKSRS